MASRRTRAEYGKGIMGKYLFHAIHTGKGLAGLLKEGGSLRRQAMTDTIEAMGGSVEFDPAIRRGCVDRHTAPSYVHLRRRQVDPIQLRTDYGLDGRTSNLLTNNT